MESTKIMVRLEAIENTLKQVEDSLLLLTSTAFSNKRSYDDKQCWVVTEHYWDFRTSENRLECKKVFAEKTDAINYMRALAAEVDGMVCENWERGAYMPDWYNAGHTIKVTEAQYHDASTASLNCD
jgi:hypothetical protein